MNLSGNWGSVSCDTLPGWPWGLRCPCVRAGMASSASTSRLSHVLRAPVRVLGDRKQTAHTPDGEVGLY